MPLYKFGPFTVDTTNHVLQREGRTLPLKPKAFDTLVVLVENRGRLLDKDELMKRLWPDTIVEESNLSQNVYLLRKILGENSDGDVYIQTLPKRGYRFVADVSVIEDELHEPTVEGTSSSGRVERQRAELYATGSSLSKRAATTVGIAAAVVLIATAAYLWISKKPTTATDRQVESVAVLPFKSLSGDSSDDRLGFFMADTLITRLSTIKSLQIRQTSAVRKFGNANQDAIAAGQELKVDAVLDGSIQRDGNHVRVTLRLISVRDASTLWTQTIDEQSSDPFLLQDRVAEQVIQRLVPELTGEERSLLAKRQTENPDADRLYQLGRYHWSKTNPDDWKKAIEYFHNAIEKDPNYALAYTGLADCYLSIVADSLLPKPEAIPQAKQAAMTALRLDDSLSEAHVSLGRIKAFYDWDWTGAEAEFRRAIELKPNSGDAHREYAAFLTSTGRSDEAVAEALRARVLDPQSNVTSFQVAWALISAGRYDDAIEQSNEVVASFPTAHYWMGAAYLAKGMNEQAATECAKTLTTQPNHLLAKSTLACAWAALGKREEAQKVLAEFQELVKQQKASPYHLAMIYAGLRDKDQAFVWLEVAYREHSRILVSGLKVNPVWNELRKDPRYADLLRRMGLPQ